MTLIRITNDIHEETMAARADLTHVLASALGAYTFGPAVRDAVDAFVSELRREGQSVEFAIAVLGASVREIRPAGMLSGNGDGKPTSRAYFAFYDSVIQRAIRTFGIGSLDDDGSVMLTRPGDTPLAARASPLWLRQRSAATQNGALASVDANLLEFPPREHYAGERSLPW